jgi:hypothetical protein
MNIQFIDVVWCFLNNDPGREIHGNWCVEKKLPTLAYVLHWYQVCSSILQPLGMRVLSTFTSSLTWIRHGTNFSLKNMSEKQAIWFMMILLVPWSGLYTWDWVAGVLQNSNGYRFFLEQPEECRSCRSTTSAGPAPSAPSKTTKTSKAKGWFFSYVPGLVRCCCPYSASCSGFSLVVESFVLMAV